MRIKENLYMAGSGTFGLSSPGDCHIYLIDCKPGLVLIDAGCGDNTELILNNIEKEGLDPAQIKWVFITHAHRDHAGGCSALKELLINKYKNKDVRFAASSRCVELMQDGSTTELGLDLFGLDDPKREDLFPCFSMDTVIKHSEKIEVGDISFTAIYTPGHSPDGLCLHTLLDNTPALFAGDIIALGGYISYGNWPDSDLSIYKESLKTLALLDVEILLPGHLMFTLKGGHDHIQKASDGFKGLFPPPAIHQLP